MKGVIVCFLLSLIFVFNVSAADVFESQSEALGLDDLEDVAPNNVGVTISEDISFDDGLSSLFSRLKSEIGGVFTRSLSCITVILVVSVLTAIISSMQPDTMKRASRCMNIVSAIAITAAASGSINSFIGMAEDAISKMCDFANVLFPTLAASVAASGSPMGAVVRHSASVFFAGNFILLINSVLVPLLYTYIAAATANAAIEGISISKICSFLEWIIGWTLKIILSAFLAYISISGFVASTGDIAGVKTISALGNSVPIIGGILSGATDAVVAGACVMKNAIGIFGLLSVLAICLTPSLVLAVNYVVFKGASALLSPICEEKTGDLVGKIGSSFGMMLAITASCALLLFISILSCMFAVGIT